MPCYYRKIGQSVTPFIGGVLGHTDTFCQLKQRDTQAQIAICSMETHLKLSSMRNDKCLFSLDNETKCPKFVQT